MGHAHGRGVAFDHGVLEPQFDGVHVELLGDLVDDRLDRERRLGRRRCPVGSRLGRVGERSGGLKLQIGELVGSHRHGADKAGHVVGAPHGVAQPTLDGRELAVVGGSDPDSGLGRRCRTGGPQDLLAAHHDLHRTARLLGQSGGDRLEVDRGLATEPTADLGRGHLDAGRVPTEDRGGLGPDTEVALGRRPDVGLAVHPDVDHTSVGLDVALMDPRGLKLALDDQVGRLEGRVDIATFEGVDRGKVGRSVTLDEHGHVVLIDQRRALGHGLVEAQHHRQQLVFDLDGRHGRRRFGFGGRGHRGQRVADVQHHATGHEVLRHVTFGVGCVQFREVGTSHHGLHAGHRLGRRGVDGKDAGMAVRRPEDRRMQLPREVQVGRKAGLPDHLVVAVGSDGSGADPLVARTILCDGHRVAPLNCTAASWTDRTILS